MEMKKLVVMWPLAYLSCAPCQGGARSVSAVDTEAVLSLGLEK